MVERFFFTWLRGIVWSQEPRERMVTWGLLVLGVAGLSPLSPTTPLAVGDPPQTVASVGAITGVVLLGLAVIISGIFAWVRTPRLDLVWDEKFISNYTAKVAALAPGLPNTVETDVQLFRLGVVNHGMRTVKSCRVRLQSFGPQGADFLPRTLRLDSKATDTFDVSHGKASAPAHLIRFCETWDKEEGSDCFYICYADNSPRPVQKGPRYTFTLILSGEDHQDVVKQYDVTVDNYKRLSLAPHRRRGPRQFRLGPYLFTVNLERVR